MSTATSDHMAWCNTEPSFVHIPTPPVLDHAEMIFVMQQAGVTVSPFMNYWTLDELSGYYHRHMPIVYVS